MVYEAVCANFEWDQILELQRLTIVTPQFTSDSFEAEKGNVRIPALNIAHLKYQYQKEVVRYQILCAQNGSHRLGCCSNRQRRRGLWRARQGIRRAGRGFGAVYPGYWQSIDLHR